MSKKDREEQKEGMEVILDLTKEPQDEVHAPEFTEGPFDLPGMTGPGVEKVRVPEIDKAAEAYILVRNQRVDLTAREVAAKECVIRLLHAKEEILGRAPDGTIRYEYDGYRVELAPTKEKLSVKVLDEDE